MPGIFAHPHITNEALGQPHPDVVLGSVLQDLAKAYQARTDDAQTQQNRRSAVVAIRGINSNLDAGIKYNGKTDAVFDGQPEKPQMTEPLCEDLQEIGVPYKAARLSANFAADIFLDTALLQDEKAVADFDALDLKVSFGGTALDGQIFPEDFTEYIKSYFSRQIPWHYVDMEAVAKITYARLAARSDHQEFKIAEDLVPGVAEVYETHVDRIGDLAVNAMRQTIMDLRVRQLEEALKAS